MNSTDEDQLDRLIRPLVEDASIGAAPTHSLVRHGHSRLRRNRVAAGLCYAAVLAIGSGVVVSAGHLGGNGPRLAASTDTSSGFGSLAGSENPLPCADPVVQSLLSEEGAPGADDPLTAARTFTLEHEDAKVQEQTDDQAVVEVSRDGTPTAQIKLVDFGNGWLAESITRCLE